jgi:hypothetical protein
VLPAADNLGPTAIRCAVAVHPAPSTPDDAKREGPPSSPPQDHWRELAERASKENDSQKLTELVEELCDELDAHDANKKAPPQKP